MVLLNFFANKSQKFIRETRNFFRVSPIILFLLFFSCVDNKVNEKNLSPEQKALIKRGKTVYMAYCIACHNLDPKLHGGTGPANHGSSLKLVEMKVIHGKYPDGYRPKRKTKLMPQFDDDLEEDILALHAFLNK